jgi:hypothetical protein
MSSHFISSETLKDGDVVHVHLNNDVSIGKAIIIREGNNFRLIETIYIEYPDGRKVNARSLEFDERAKFSLVTP